MELMNRIEFKKLVDERILVCDGGTGTQFYNRGVFINCCYDALNLTRPALVEEVHRGYVEAGADIIETNTFSANRFRLSPHGLEDSIEEINRRGVELARKAATDNVMIAGAIGPIGLRIEPWGPTSVDEARAAFKEQAEILFDNGIDLFILETFSDLSEIQQALLAVREVAPDLPVIAQMTIGHDGSGLYGTEPSTFLERLEDWGADAVGLNCSVGPETMLSAIEKISTSRTYRLSAQPNAGIPRAIHGRNIYMATPEYMAEYAKRFIQSGVRIVGGCCGTTPEHIKAIGKAVKALNSNIGSINLDRKIPKLETKDSIKPMVQTVKMEDKSAFAKKLANGEFVVTMELTPPRGIVADKQLAGALELKEWGIDAINIPDGPRASSRMSPLAMSLLIEREVGIETILHYCCRDRNLLGMQSDLMGASALGLHNLLVITGDPPKLGDYPDATAVFDVDSIGLTNVVNRLNHGFDIGNNEIGKPTGFCIGVGANPGAIDLDEEVKRFNFKVEAGAEYAITQPVFDIELLKDFLERIKDHRIPVIAGIWPLASLRNAQFMNNEVPGADVPDCYMKRMEKCSTKEEGRQEGLAIAQEMCEAAFPLVQGFQISVPFGRTKRLHDLLDSVRALKK
jgi:homocysteine S-methyltransferase